MAVALYWVQKNGRIWHDIKFIMNIILHRNLFDENQQIMLQLQSRIFFFIQINGE